MNGYKTYALAGVAIVGAAIGWYFEFIPKETAILLFTTGLGFAGLRHGVNKV